MNTFYRNYPVARKAAAELAARLDLPVRLKAVKEYGVAGFVVSLACGMDTQDFEVVRPGDPL